MDGIEPRRVPAGRAGGGAVAARAPATDALNDLPASYGDVPKLGPPLPGDLGRPIFERQRQLTMETRSPMPTVDTAAQAAAAERERMLAERTAARESGLPLLPVAGSAAAAAAGSIGPPVAIAAPDSAAKVALDPGNDPNARGRKGELMAALDLRGDNDPHALVPASSRSV